MTTPNDNPFQPEHAYTMRQFRDRAPMCERSVYNKFESGQLRARHIGRNLVIVNAFEWFESLPPYRKGEGPMPGVKKAKPAEQGRAA